MNPVKEGVDPVGAEDRERLLEVWEASVRATHHFLTESDIQFFRPLVREGVFHLPHLWCVRNSTGVLVGFVGVAGLKMEALFVHPGWHGLGIGRRLALYAVKTLGATDVDVNEQNEQAVGFYHSLGYEVYGREVSRSRSGPRKAVS